jgi:two-component system, LuxR family, response regulator FixJ
MNKRPLIGIVDDDTSVRNALRRFCNVHKLRVHAFMSGQMLFDSILAGVVPDCLLLDFEMPDVSGIDVQTWLLKRQISIPVIMITGHEDERIKARSLALGAHDVLYKPLDLHRLLHTIKDALFYATKVQCTTLLRDARLTAQI